MWWHLGKGRWEAPSIGWGMIFLLDFLGLVSVALCSGPRARARAMGGGNLEAPSRKAFKWMPAGLGWVRVPWAWQGRRESCSEKNTVGELPCGKGSKSK